MILIREKNIKKIGVAIYANERENVEDSYKMVKSYPDFIHIDLVDSSFYPLAEKPDLMKIKYIKNMWPDKIIILHIMSNNPTDYFSSNLQYVDFILIHAEIPGKIEDLIAKLSGLNMQIGISVQYQTPVETLFPIIERLKMVQVMGIQKPGYSGQILAPFAITYLEQVNKLKTNFNFVTCFDGGVTIENIVKINTDYIVSGSSVLRSDDPINTILTMRKLANQSQ